MDDPSLLPSISEPLFSEFGATIEIFPVMDREDLERGLSALGSKGFRHASVAAICTPGPGCPATHHSAGSAATAASVGTSSLWALMNVIETSKATANRAAPQKNATW